MKLKWISAISIPVLLTGIVPAAALTSCSNNKIKVIVDTDVGNDCDDIGALTILGNAYKKNLVDVVGVTVCTRATEPEKQYDALYTTDIILEKYGINCPIGLTTVDNFIPENLAYATEVSHRWQARTKDHETQIMPAHKLLRKVISENKGVKLITIGMLNNIKAFMDTNEDGVTGKQLLEENVSEMVMMGGNFVDQTYKEYNIVKKLEASQVVINNTSVRKTFLDWETGQLVKTGLTFYAHPDSPQCVSYSVFNHGNLRESWDPMTVYIAIFGAWSYSKWGKVTVDAEGCTKFTEDPNGVCRYVPVHPNPTLFAQELESWMTV